jgi:hypothetical protein
MLQMKDNNNNNNNNNNIGVPKHIKASYGCYKTSKNGSLHIHSLLWLNDSLDLNTLVHMLCDNEGFQKT